jgi:hypothetical protein
MRSEADEPIILIGLLIGQAYVSGLPCRASKGRAMMFTIEFFRVREKDNARATLDRITQVASDLEGAKVKARSLFDTLNMPQNPDGLRILDQDGHEVFFWTPGADED